ncbi:MAG TPA: diacylglycerol kinase family protein [Pseudonocardia sp.]|nr:diacylglycerol kinase family protein [Pseudonocardia sp.]
MLLAVVANTRSGGNTDPDRIIRLLTERGATVRRLTLDALDDPLGDGVERLVVAGGDGSLGVAARAAHREKVPLAVLPTGTANDFARALDLPRDLEQACALAADPTAATRHREVGLFGDHPFVNAAAAGLSAVASRRAEPHKPRLGPLAYAVGALLAGATAPPLRCRVRCDGTERFAGDVWQVVVGATGAFGGGSQIGGTRPDDGLLDVAVVPAGPRVALVRRAYGMRRGQLTEQADVPHHRGRKIEIDLPPGTPFNVDGDVRECHPALFALLPGGVEVVVP